MAIFWIRSHTFFVTTTSLVASLCRLHIPDILCLLINSCGFSCLISNAICQHPELSELKLRVSVKHQRDVQIPPHLFQEVTKVQRKSQFLLVKQSHVAFSRARAASHCINTMAVSTENSRTIILRNKFWTACTLPAYGNANSRELRKHSLNYFWLLQRRQTSVLQVRVHRG